jgi:outer membrane lipoprotein-sorting protein
MKRIFSILLLAGVTISAQAQDEKAKKILTELSTKAKAFTSIQATFGKSFVKGKINETASGSLAVKGKKYYAETGEGQNLYCDGRTVWTHVIDSKEVIKCPLEEVIKEAPMDPSQMFTIWEKDFKQKWVKEETINGAVHDVIDLYPVKPTEKQFHTITLKINRDKKEVYQFIIKGNDGSVTTYTLKTFVTNQEIPDSKFIFNTGKFPGVEVIDC